jgi:hypothetical protein
MFSETSVVFLQTTRRYICHNRWMDRGWPTAQPPCPVGLTPLHLYPWQHLKFLLPLALFTKWKNVASEHCERLADCRRLSRDVCPWSHGPKHMWNLTEDIWALPVHAPLQCCNSEKKRLGTTFMLTYFGTWSSAPKFVRRFHILYMPPALTLKRTHRFAHRLHLGTVQFSE